MPKSRTRPKSKRMPTPREALGAMMSFHGSLRPPGTVDSCFQNALAAYAESGEPTEDGLMGFPIDTSLMGQTLIHGWVPDPEWEKQDDQLFLAIFQQVMKDYVAKLLLPAPFPSRWAKGEDGTLWSHLDYLGFRGIACLGEDKALEAGEDSPYFQAQVHGMRILEEFDRLTGAPRHAHAFDTAGLLRDFAECLAQGHAWITAEASSPKAEWPEPVLPSFPGFAADPEMLEAEFRRRGIRRPLDSAFTWVGLFSALKRELHPFWKWIPSLDGREIAVTLFDALGEDGEFVWSADEMGRLSALATALHRACENRALPPPPRLEDLAALSADPNEAPALLWDHFDRLHMAYLALVMTGWATFETKGVPKKDRRLSGAVMDALGFLMGSIYRWPQADQAFRVEALRMAEPMLWAIYGLMRPLLERIPGELQALLPSLEGMTSERIALLRSNRTAKTP